MQLTVKNKLRLGFLSLLAIVVFLSFFTINSLQNLSDSTDLELSRLLETQELSQRISSDLYQEMLAAQNYMITRRASSREVYEARSRSLLRNLEHLLAKQRSADGREQLEEIRSAHANLTVKVAQAFAIADRGSQEVALQEAREILSVNQLLQESMDRFRLLETKQLAQVRGAIARDVDRARLILMALALLLTAMGVALLFWSIRSITLPLANLVDATNLVSRGDLTKEVPAEGGDEFAQLARSFNAMSANLRELVGQVNAASETVALSAAGLSSSTEELNASAEEISSTMALISDGAEAQSAKAQRAMEIMVGLLEASRSMQRNVLAADEVGGRIQHVAATNVREIESAHDQLLDIQTAVETSARLIAQFGDNSQRIGEFVDSINAIAAQTNLLALNAAIEAARAGEHGRGFAVVAEEVHKLAEESAKSAESARRTIRETRQHMENAVVAMARTQEKVTLIGEVSTRTRGGLAQIGEGVEEAARSTFAITEATQRQMSQIEEMRHWVEEISRTAESNVASATEVLAATEEQTASMQEMSSAAQDLSHHADLMKRAIDAFVIDDPDIAARPSADRDGSSPSSRRFVERRDLKTRPWTSHDVEWPESAADPHARDERTEPRRLTSGGSGPAA